MSMEQERMFQEEKAFVQFCEPSYPECPCLTCGKTPMKNGVLCCYKRHKLCGQPCPDYEREGA